MKKYLLLLLLFPTLAMGQGFSVYTYEDIGYYYIGGTQFGTYFTPHISTYGSASCGSDFSGVSYVQIRTMSNGNSWAGGRKWNSFYASQDDTFPTLWLNDDNTHDISEAVSVELTCKDESTTYYPYNYFYDYPFLNGTSPNQYPGPCVDDYFVPNACPNWPPQNAGNTHYHVADFKIPKLIKEFYTYVLNTDTCNPPCNGLNPNTWNVIPWCTAATTPPVYSPTAVTDPQGRFNYWWVFAGCMHLGGRIGWLCFPSTPAWWIGSPPWSPNDPARQQFAQPRKACSIVTQ